MPIHHFKFRLNPQTMLRLAAGAAVVGCAPSVQARGAPDHSAPTPAPNFSGCPTWPTPAAAGGSDYDVFVSGPYRDNEAFAGPGQPAVAGSGYFVEVGHNPVASGRQTMPAQACTTLGASLVCESSRLNAYEPGIAAPLQALQRCVARVSQDAAAVDEANALLRVYTEVLGMGDQANCTWALLAANLEYDTVKNSIVAYVGNHPAVFDASLVASYAAAVQEAAHAGEQCAEIDSSLQNLKHARCHRDSRAGFGSSCDGWRPRRSPG